MPLPPKMIKREELCFFHTKIWKRQLDWLRSQSGDGVRQAEMVRAALDDYIERIGSDGPEQI